MPPLERIELQVLQALPALDLRPTLERAAEVGRLLAEARALVPHGGWIPWLGRMRLSRSSAWEYMAVYRHLDPADVRPGARLGFRQFVDRLRKARYKERDAERDQARAEMAGTRGRLPAGVTLAHRDCRRYDWPPGLDGVCTDPPWADLDSYKWLARMAADRLRPGGLLLAVAGAPKLAAVVSACEAAGLTYVWLLAYAYCQSHQARPTRCFRATHRPVVLFSRGAPALPAGTTLADFFSLKAERKTLHPWQQPTAAFAYWLAALFPVGAVVADPFAGSGTTGEACVRAGLRFVGTEVDRDTYRVARGRLRRLAGYGASRGADAARDRPPAHG